MKLRKLLLSLSFGYLMLCLIGALLILFSAFSSTDKSFILSCIILAVFFSVGLFVNISLWRKSGTYYMDEFWLRFFLFFVVFIVFTVLLFFLFYSMREIASS